MNQSAIAEAPHGLADSSACTQAVGYAYFQQQDPQAFGHSEQVSIILFFAIIAALILSFVIYFWMTECLTISPQQRRKWKLEIGKEMDQLIENLKWQLATCVKLPVVPLAVVLWKATVGRQHSHGRRIRHTVGGDRVPVSMAVGAHRGFSLRQQKVLKHKYHHLVSLLFLGVFIIAIFVLLSTLWTPPIQSTVTILEAAVFAFVLSINLFFITRQHFYYIKRKELFGRDHPQMLALSKTHFYDWDRGMWGNWVQLAILVIEFFQLLSFPLRDMLAAASTNLDDASSANACQIDAAANTTSVTQFQKMVTTIVNVGGLIPDMHSPTWYRYTLWSTFTVVCVSMTVAAVVHGLNYWRPYMVPVRWVHWFVPIANLMYYPVLTTFVSSAACQSLNVATDPLITTLRCHAADIGHQEYLWISLIGYAIAYVMMTTFVTSYERVPLDGEIAFKTMGVAFIKNMGLLLMINSLLIESTSTVRAILSIAILLTMVCYNVNTRPCYVEKINHIRTASFSCILWTSVLVGMLNDVHKVSALGPYIILGMIGGGWCVIIALFFVIYRYYIPLLDRDIDISGEMEVGVYGIYAGAWAAEVQRSKSMLQVVGRHGGEPDCEELVMENPEEANEGIWRQTISTSADDREEKEIMEWWQAWNRSMGR